MKTRNLLFISASTLLLAFSGSAIAQNGPQNHRQRKLDRRETVNSNKQARIAERNPNGVGRHDNRVARRGRHIERKQARTDRRVARRRGNGNS